MTLRVGSPAPRFAAVTQHGQVVFPEWGRGRWVVLFTYAGDADEVSITEISAVTKLLPAFRCRDANVLGLSPTLSPSRAAWLKRIHKLPDDIPFPVVRDEDYRIAGLLGLAPGADTVTTSHAVMLFDPNAKLRLSLTYPATTGRNFREILRVIDSVQMADRYSVATPADWNTGDDVILMSVRPRTTAQAPRFFSDGADVPRLRCVK